MPGQAEEQQGATTFEDINAATQGGTLISIPSHVPSTTDTKRASQTIQIGRGDNLKTLYRYSPLPGLKAIRLLRLLPHQKENASIECELFDYPLTGPGEGPHLYEALSYAWGSQYKPYSISINSSKFPVTANLYTALLRLRDRFIVRILWVDAICIDQHNEIEKAEQVQYMAEIFSKASRVVVWLGEAENDGERALEEIRFAADEESTERLVDGSTKQAILALLQRPWFERIWVLQETAAARNVIIKCGSAEIDGYAFCVGLNSRSLNLLYRDSPDLQSLISSIIYLIKGATFRPKRVPRSSGGFSLHIRPLSDLIEMFHTRKATILHDKVIALLGMSSDDPTAAGLSPDYKIPWEKLLERLIKFLLGGEVLVKTWDKTEMAVVKSKGYILGKVFSSEDKGPNDRRRVVVTIKDSSGNMSLKREWTLPASVKTIQSGDLVCFLHGAPKPTIIRPYRDHFSIIFVSVTPLENTGEKHNNILSPEHPSTLRDFSLVWDWGQVQETTLDREDREEYDTQIGSRVFENAKTEAGDHLEKIIRLLNTAKILQDAEEHKKAGERLRDILEGYEEEFGKNDLCILECKERLAQIYKKTRQWKEAKELFEQVIHSRKQVQGLDHEDTIRSISDLAALYRNQGDLELLRSENLTTSQMMAMLNQSDVQGEAF
ncbi:heterokaryon incompatibility protein-domain-containing protein [Xylaria longipes]|nr:heterokaryon incompatibility protein-domain-containing protein [Xylaria longipes]